MAEIILQPALNPPKDFGNTVHRQRITRLLSENRSMALILLCAEAGSGKTTAIRDFIHSEKLICAWLSAGSYITEPFTFINYLIYSLRRINPAFGENILRLSASLQKDGLHRSEKDDMLSSIINVFINNIHKDFKEEIYLVIDDFEKIDIKSNADWIAQIFSSFTGNIPANLHMIILTRNYPSFDLSNIAAKRKIFELTGEEINFNKEEIVNVLDGIYNLAYSEDDVSFFRKEMSGWITGIHMILQTYKNDLGKIKFNKGLVTEKLFNFFAENIFNGLGAEIREFLLNTSIIENFNSDICDKVLNIKTSKKIIAELKSRNIFIQQAPPEYSMKINNKGLSNYNYQTLFSEFLIQKLHDVRSLPEIDLIFKKIAGYHIQNNNREDAVNYFIKGSDHKSAIEIIKKDYAKINEEGSHSSLWNWLESIPENIIIKDPVLLLLKGKTNKNVTGDLDRSFYYFKSAIKLFKSKNIFNKEISVKCRIHYSEVLLQLGKDKTAFKELQILSKLKAGAENTAGIFYYTGLYYNSNSKYDEAISALNTSLGICEKNNLKQLMNSNLILLGSIYFLRGEFIKSLYYNEKVELNDNDYYKKLRLLSVLAFLNSYTGNYDIAKEYLDSAYRIYELFPVKYFKLGLLYADAKLRNVTGDYEESNKLLEKVEKLANRTNRKYYLVHCCLLKIENYFYLDDVSSTRQNFELWKKQIDEENEGSRITCNLYEVILNKDNNENKKIKTNELSPEKKLLAALKHYKKNNLQLETTQAYFHLSNYYYEKKIKNSSIEYIEKFLNSVQENLYLPLLESKVFKYRDLLEFAISNNIKADLIKTIIHNVNNKTDIIWLSEECKKRIQDQLENYYDINMTSFGGLEFKSRGRRIPENIWTRKKGKLILAYLLTRPESRLTKDKAIDMFFPELPPGKAEPLFHNAINIIRIALNPVSEHEHKSSRSTDPLSREYLIYENKTLSLNNDHVYNSDALELDKLYRKINPGKISEAETIKNCEHALSLYKGEFLEEYYEPWAEDLRDNYRNKYFFIYNRLVSILNKNNMFDEIISYSKTVLERDNLNTEAYMNITEAYANTGKHELSKEYYNSLLNMYKEELKEAPPKHIIEKAALIFSNKA